MAVPPEAITLANDHIQITFEPQHGRIIGLVHAGLDISVVNEAQLADNWRLLVPLPGLRGHEVLGRLQPLADVQQEADHVRLTWTHLQTPQTTLDIALHLVVRLADDDVIFTAEIENHSGCTIEEVALPALGGLTNPAEQDDWRCLHSTWDGTGNEWAVYRTFPGSYLGPAAPIWQASYADNLSMPWLDLYHSTARKGFSFGNYDPSPRYSLVRMQLFPGTTWVGDAQQWPEPRVGEPMGITLSWIGVPFIAPGEHYQGPPIILHFHAGTWYAAADYYRAWYDRTIGPLDKTISWLAGEDAWQSTIISYPDDTIGYRFTDLPRLAAAAQEVGIHVLQLDGWDIGGIDRGYPQYTPDPRLGTWDELAQAITTCRALGVRVLLFTNLQWANLETAWFDQELVHYAARDPFGHLRNSMGWEYHTALGMANQCESRMVLMDPAHPAYQRIILEQWGNIVALGAAGVQVDKIGGGFGLDYAPEVPGRIDERVMGGILTTFARFTAQSRARAPDFCLASETHWDRMMPYADATYARFFSRTHIPLTEYTFPEYRQTCCIPGPYDFGLVNNCLRYGHIINIEARYLHGSVADVPELGRYVAEVLRLRRSLRDRLWESRVVEPLGVTVDDLTGAVQYSLHRSRVGAGDTLVLNHFTRGDCTVKIHAEGNYQAMLYRPFCDAEQIDLPGVVTISPDQCVILAFSSAQP